MFFIEMLQHERYEVERNQRLTATKHTLVAVNPTNQVLVVQINL